MGHVQSIIAKVLYSVVFFYTSLLFLIVHGFNKAVYTVKEGEALRATFGTDVKDRMAFRRFTLSGHEEFFVEQNFDMPSSRCLYQSNNKQSWCM